MKLIYYSSFIYKVQWINLGLALILDDFDQPVIPIEENCGNCRSYVFSSEKGILDSFRSWFGWHRNKHIFIQKIILNSFILHSFNGKVKSQKQWIINFISNMLCFIIHRIKKLIVIPTIYISIANSINNSYST